MANKSLIKEYELGHSYDFCKDSNPKCKKFIKRNSHRRVRRRFNKITKEKVSNDNT